jgi:hypothetical protein
MVFEYTVDDVYLSRNQMGVSPNKEREESGVERHQGLRAVILPWFNFAILGNQRQT